MMPRWTRVLAFAACALAGSLPLQARADDFTWQALYQCSLYASSVSELVASQGRDGIAFEKEFDALVTAALNAHKAEHERLYPKASREDWASAWDADTTRVEDAFVMDVDASASAIDFLKTGYSACRPERTYALMKKLGTGGRN